jgi:hypothetical protein
MANAMLAVIENCAINVTHKTDVTVLVNTNVNFLIVVSFADPTSIVVGLLQASISIKSWFAVLGVPIIVTATLLTSARLLVAIIPRPLVLLSQLRQPVVERFVESVVFGLCITVIGQSFLEACLGGLLLGNKSLTCIAYAVQFATVF